MTEALELFTSIKAAGKAASVSAQDFRLALNEALQNALSHGNAYNPEKLITVTIRAYKHKEVITVKNEGEGFRAEEVADPRAAENMFKGHGREVCLMRSLYNVRWCDGGRRVRIEV